MKRPLPILVLVGLVIGPSGLHAQRGRLDRIRRAFRNDAVEIGVIGGPNRNTVTGAGPVDAKFRGLLGGFLSVPLAGDLRLRPEIAVSGKLVGFSTQLDPTTTQPETASFTWLEVPLLLEARFPRAIGNWGTPRLYAGPFVAVRLSCSSTTPLSNVALPEQTGEPQVVRSCNTADGSATRYNNGDAGFVLGGTLGAGMVGIGVRWTRSLLPIAPDQSVIGGSRLIGAKHSTLAVTLEFATRLY